MRSNGSSDWLACAVAWFVLGLAILLRGFAIMLAYWVFQQIFHIEGLPLALTFWQGMGLSALWSLLVVISK